MPLREDILNPIPGDNPSGINIRTDPVYLKIKDARTEEDDAPQGEWVHERKVADWGLVLKLANDILATKSKDLEISGWLTDALVRKEGFAGLRQGLELTKGLLENFWDTLYPQVAEEEDLELRAAKLEWIGSQLDRPLREVALNKQGHNWYQYKESRAIPTEEEAGADDKKSEVRRARLEDGKLAPEVFDRAFEGSPKAYYVEMVETLDACLELLDGIKQIGEEKFGQYSPNLGPLRTTLEEIRHTANLLLQKKRELEPDVTAEAEAAAETTGGSAEAGVAGAVIRPTAGGMVYRAASLTDEIFLSAQQTARAGRLSEALGLLMEQLANEASARGRFIRRTQIAQVCLESGQEGIAMPILEELAAEIDRRNLEDWEFGEVIARPLALLYKCMVKQDREYDDRAKLYARVCRLSPIEALGVAR